MGLDTKEYGYWLKTLAAYYKKEKEAIERGNR